MKSIQIKNLILNKGIPKICVPVTGVTEDEILNEFLVLNNIDIDLAELRVDYYEGVQDETKVMDLLKKIRELYDKPLLFTLRSKKEGGVSPVSPDYYFKLNWNVIENKLVDLIDIEFFSSFKDVADTIDLAKKNSIISILSYHDFTQTPTKDEIISKFNQMMEWGDIAKIAVMANSEEDVLTLMSSSLQLKKEKKGPFIAIAMGPLGIISRISCEMFGSCMTYAAHKKLSAPGQIDYVFAREILKTLHL